MTYTLYVIKFTKRSKKLLIKAAKRSKFKPEPYPTENCIYLPAHANADCCLNPT